MIQRNAAIPSAEFCGFCCAFSQQQEGLLYLLDGMQPIMPGLNNLYCFRQMTRRFPGVITPKAKRSPAADGHKGLKIRHAVYSDNGCHFIKELRPIAICFANRQEMEYGSIPKTLNLADRIIAFIMASFRLNAEVPANSMPKRSEQINSAEMEIIYSKNEYTVQKLRWIRFLFYDINSVLLFAYFSPNVSTTSARAESTIFKTRRKYDRSL